MILPDPPILVITDRRQCAEPLETRAEALFRGGCRWLSLREKALEPAERRALLQRLIAIGRAHGALVGVHGDPGAAHALGAPLHLPADADAAAARQAAPGIILGQSCHGAAELACAASAGLDYASLGPIFESASKPGYRGPIAPGDLAAITAGTTLPVIALGGVTIDALPHLAGSGCAGIAVMGEAMRTRTPERWFADLARTWRGMVIPVQAPA